MQDNSQWPPVVGAGTTNPGRRVSQQAEPLLLTDKVLDWLLTDASPATLREWGLSLKLALKWTESLWQHNKVPMDWLNGDEVILAETMDTDIGTIIRWRGQHDRGELETPDRLKLFEEYATCTVMSKVGGDRYLKKERELTGLGLPVRARR